MADVEDEPQALQVQVAGMGEVGASGAGQVLDDDGSTPVSSCSSRSATNERSRAATTFGSRGPGSGRQSGCTT